MVRSTTKCTEIRKAGEDNPSFFFSTHTLSSSHIVAAWLRHMKRWIRRSSSGVNLVERGKLCYVECRRLDSHFGRFMGDAALWWQQYWILHRFCILRVEGGNAAKMAVHNWCMATKDLHKVSNANFAKTNLTLWCRSKLRNWVPWGKLLSKHALIQYAWLIVNLGCPFTVNMSKENL